MMSHVIDWIRANPRTPPASPMPRTVAKSDIDTPFLIG
jgi:hypothetical protein